MTPIITLTTDFGHHDWFVGVMKGVICQIHPQARIVDICHEIPPGDIKAGAFSLLSSFAFFPQGTVHIAVIDPGVGSERSPIAVKTENFLFVAPDNGVLAWALTKEKVESIHRLDNPKYFLGERSRTFHGRDVFAPVGAYLSKGTAIEELGLEQKELISFPWPKTELLKHGIKGEILYFDRFGNGITNIPEKAVTGWELHGAALTNDPNNYFPIVEYYQAVPEQKPLGVFGATGFFEIAINGGSAEKNLNISIGSQVAIIFSS